MGTSYNPSIVKSNLVLNFDAGNSKSWTGSGTAWIDLTKNKTGMTFYNSPLYNKGLLSFSKTSLHYAETSANLSSLSTWTCEVWVKFATVPVSGTDVSALITGLYDGVSKINFTLGVVGVPADGLIRAGFYDGVWRNTAGHQPVAETWYNYVGTYDGTTIKLYVNGQLYAQTSYTGTPQSGGTVRIGRRWDSAATSSNYIDGLIPIARVYNRALSATEVLQNYNAIKNRYSPIINQQNALHTWLESDYGVVTIDAGGNEQSSPVVGNAVKRWVSRVGSINFSNTTTANMPTYAIDSNGVPYLSFAGSQTLNATIGNYNWVSTNISSWFGGWYTTGTASNQDVFSVTTGGAGYPGIDMYARQYYGASNSCSMGSADSIPVGNGVGFPANSAQLNAFQGLHVDMSPFSGGINRGWLNNGSVYNAANTTANFASTSFPATPTIGRYGGNYNYYTGRVYYLIAYSGVFADHTAMYNYLSSKYKYT